MRRHGVSLAGAHSRSILTERTTRVGLARKSLRSFELLDARMTITTFKMELASRQTVDMVTVERWYMSPMPEKNSESQGGLTSRCGLFFSQGRKGERK
jgi:hypothetical protein